MKALQDPASPKVWKTKLGVPTLTLFLLFIVTLGQEGGEEK